MNQDNTVLWILGAVLAALLLLPANPSPPSPDEGDTWQQAAQAYREGSAALLLEYKDEPKTLPTANALKADWDELHRTTYYDAKEAGLSLWYEDKAEEAAALILNKTGG